MLWRTCENRSFCLGQGGGVYPLRSVQIRGENGANKTNAARGPATLEPHRSWTFKAAFPSLRAAGTTVPVRQRSHSQRAPHLPALLQTCDSENRCPATSVVASSPTQLKERGVEEAAMPGQPARAHARFRFPTGNSRSRIAGLPPASPQSSFGASLEVPTYLVETLCGRSFRVAIEKRSPVVQKLWTMALPCGSLRKSVEELHRQTPAALGCQ